MSTHKIKQTSNWPALTRAFEAIARGEQPPASAYAAIADRLRTAIEAPDAGKVQAAADILEQLYANAAAIASPGVRAASRGEDQGDLATSYTLGKLAFAQLLAARIADTRADDRFVEHVRNRLYLPYLQAMFGEPLTVSALQEKVGVRLETVSRKLGVLRDLGLVVSKRQGNEVVNMLTPAAVVTMEALGVSPMADPVPIVRAPDVQEKLDQERGTLKPHMQKTPPFSGRNDVVQFKYG